MLDEYRAARWRIVYLGFALLGLGQLLIPFLGMCKGLLMLMLMLKGLSKHQRNILLTRTAPKAIRVKEQLMLVVRLLLVLGRLIWIVL